MKLSDVTIWVNDNLLTEKSVIEAIKDFGGIAAFHPIGLHISEYFDKDKNLYAIDNPDLGILKRYLGEYGTNRWTFPMDLIKKHRNRIYLDESSPKRIKKTTQEINGWICRKGYSSYRKHFFSIITKKTDFNFRFPFLSPLSTIKKLNTDFVWLCINKNQYFCLPYWNKQAKAIWFNKPFIRIPFDWHVKGMIKYCEENNKKLFIYAGDGDITKEQFLKRIALLKTHFNKMGEK